MSIRARKLIQILKKDDWQETKDKVKSSHRKFKKDGKFIIVPFHSNSDIPFPLLQSIKKQAGLKL